MPKVFGELLENIPEQDGVPFVVNELLNYLSEKEVRLQVEGIFRISGKQDDIIKIKHLYDKGEEVDLHQYDIHTVAGVLRSFFRELPESLITHENVCFF